MKLFYLKYTVFESSYRCDLVRKRLIKFMETNQPHAIVISGLLPEQIKAFDDFTQHLGLDDITFIFKPSEHIIKGHRLLTSDTHLLVDKHLITPIEGCLAIVDLDPYKLDYIVLDIFADETFSHYHSELDDHHLKELTDLLSKKI
jgi:hypothetical protein